MANNLDSTAPFDALIVGARCAGAATAMLLARSGLRVLAIDRGRRGTDTVSTHALMRGAVLLLQRWGLLDRVIASGTPPVRRTTFHYDDEVIPVEITARAGVDALYAPRRTVLDSLLVDAAREAGASLSFGTRIVELSHSASGRVNGADVETEDGTRHHVAARLVIGADGLHSTVARLTRAGTRAIGHHMTAVLYGYWRGLALDGYHWYYRPGVSAGAIPTTGGETCVFAAMPAGRFVTGVRHQVAAGYRQVLAEAAPELARALEHAEASSHLRGFGGEPGFMRQCWGPGWALVGDAGYFRDPLTAHGITDALRDAHTLARAVVEGSDRALATYQETRDDLALPLFEVTDRIASFEWDMTSLQRDHRTLAKEMSRGADWLAEQYIGARRQASGSGLGAAPGSGLQARG